MTKDFAIGTVDIPPLALGTMYFGTTVSRESAHACLDTAFDVGARFWDTANNYAFWAGGVGDESEACLGSWFARHPGARDQVVLATKIGARPRVVGAGLDDSCGLSRAAIIAQVDGCLRRLQTTHVDILYAHVDDPSTEFSETLGAFDELITAGKVREIAASNLTPTRLRAALCTPAPHAYRALQQRFTHRVPEPGTDLAPHVLLDSEIEEVCGDASVTMLGYSPLLSGAYTNRAKPFPDGYRCRDGSIAAMRRIAANNGWDLGQLVLAWMVQRRIPVVPVVGVSNAAQVSAAWAGVSGSRIAAADLCRLEELRDG